MDRLLTGSTALDTALGGGLTAGSSFLIEGPQGVGSTEFALSLLRAVSATPDRTAVFATALRAPQRARLEAASLFDSPSEANKIDFRPIGRTQALADCLGLLRSLGVGDALVLESTAALTRTDAGHDLAGFLETLGDAASETGAVVLYLHAPGSLPHGLEMVLGEAADGVFTFAWRDGGPTKRRSLFISKLRGLSPALGGEQIPVFEATLQTGAGFTMSRVKSVV